VLGVSVGYIGEQIVIGRDRLVLSDSGVCVENGRIVLVGQQRHIREASDQIVVCDDCTIMPGLIDTHVHLALSGGVDPLGDYMRTPPDRLLLQMTRRAAALLNAGVTSARDCGGPALTLTVRDGISAGEVLGPRLLVCGQPITITGGHCHPFGMLADTAEDCRAAARQVLGQGVDFLKVMVTGGTMTHGCPAWQSQYDGPEIDAIVTEGTRWGKPTAAHCHGVQGIALAARAGVRTIEHCSWMVPSGHSYDADITAEIAVKFRSFFVQPETGA
jgi:imidazolonepropionase-like amidohydrolase